MSETPQNGTRENPQVVEVQNAIPTNVVIRIFVIGFTVMLVLSLGVPFGLRWYDQDKRITSQERQLDAITALARQNRLLVNRLNRERIERQAAANDFAYQQCVQNESRDTVNVLVNLAWIRLLDELTSPDAPAKVRAEVAKLKQSLRDANATLEPEDEPDCTPPSAATP